MSGLVNKSASWPSVGIQKRAISFALTISRKKAMRVAICLSLLLEVADSDKRTADLLSQKIGAFFCTGP